MDVKFSPSVPHGKIKAPPSKSEAHRALICAALANAPTVIRLPEISEDINATARGVRALGAEVSGTEEGLLVQPGKSAAPPVFDCGESGSTLRFLLPAASARLSCARFSGRGRLPERPLLPLIRAMESHGVAFSSSRLPLEISGGLQPGLFELPGDVSSQFISGLLMALPCLAGESRVRLTSPLEGKGYVEITIQTLKKFGIAVEREKNGWRIAGGQTFASPGSVDIEGDWSNAAFFLCAGAASGNVTVSGLDPDSAQGDRAVLDILRQMGAAISVSGDEVTVSASRLRGCEIDMRDTPDLLPPLCAAAAFAEGETRFINAARLRSKESDRLSASAELLRALGGAAQELPEGLSVHGSGLKGGFAGCLNDHRMVMAAATAALGASGEVSLSGAESAGKSWPDFFEKYREVGGKAEITG